MVHIVLDPPGLKGVYEGGKHEGPHYILHQLVLAESSVAAVMPHHKELHKSHRAESKSRISDRLLLLLNALCHTEIPLEPLHTAQG